jgi:putative ABC transport system permease protein
VPGIKSKISLADDHSAILSVNALKALSLPEDEQALDKQLSVKIFYPSADGVVSGDVTEVKTTDLKTPLNVRGILTDNSLPPFVLVPEHTVLEQPPYYERMYVRADREENIEKVREELISRGFLVSSKIDLVKQIKKITSVITIILGIFGITALVVSAIGMFNTMVISFLEKIYEVGIMKAIGATDRDIKNLFLMESFIMGVLGGLGGIFTGIMIGEITNFGINLLAVNFGGKPVDLFVRPWWFMLLIVVFSGAIGLLSGYWPSRMATRVSPKEAFMRK